MVNYARDAAAAAAVVADIEKAGGRGLAVQGDVSREEDVLRLFGATDAEFGPVTALVNNAGMLNRRTRLTDMTAEAIARVLAVNTFGSILCAREAIRRMSIKRGGSGGAIVNLSSVAARMGGANEFVDYAAAKGAIDFVDHRAFTRGGCRGNPGQRCQARLDPHRYPRERGRSGSAGETQGRDPDRSPRHGG